MKFGVVVFPGSNCDRDMIHVLKNACEKEVQPIWHKETNIPDVDAIALPGGFSYGDYLRTGAIARFSPVMNSVIDFANKGGIVFGICNGFQILCESGLLPGVLLRNSNQKFICKNTYIKATTESIFSQGSMLNKVLKVPIAHAEGRYYAPKDILENMYENDQIVYKYCNAQGDESTDSNPNGSLDNIAGVRNKMGNVFGMMPHPERASEDELGNVDGMEFFHSILKAASQMTV